MTRHATVHGIMLAMAALVACDGRVPTPVGPSQALGNAPAPSPSPNPAPPNPPPPGPVPGTHPLAGVYTLELNIGSACAAVPAAEKTRRYTATIDYASEGRYVVTLSDATFLSGPICTAATGRFSGIGCHQFFASEDIDTALLFLENNNDEAHGGHIVERLSSGAWVEIIGSASGRYGPSSIEAAGTGSVWYCPTPSAYPFPCSNYAFCQPTDITLRFNRK